MRFAVLLWLTLFGPRYSDLKNDKCGLRAVVCRGTSVVFSSFFLKRKRKRGKREIEEMFPKTRHLTESEKSGTLINSIPLWSKKKKKRRKIRIVFSKGEKKQGNQENVFPGQSPRRFCESEREILPTSSMSHYEDHALLFCCFFARFFVSEDYLGNLNLLRPNILGEKKKKKNGGQD